MVPPTTFRRLDRMLRRLGFESRPGKGSHVFYYHSDGRTVSLPNHRGRDIGSELIAKVLRDAKLSRDDYLAMR